MNPKLLRSWGPQVATYLQERGITLDTIQANKIDVPERVKASDYRRCLGFDRWGNQALHEVVTESIWFSCRDANTTIQSCIVRPFPALVSEDGSAGAKFLTTRRVAAGIHLFLRQPGRPPLNQTAPC